MNDEKKQYKYCTNCNRKVPCYEVTFVNWQNYQKTHYRFVTGHREHMRRVRKNRFPALATLLYVDWLLTG